MRINAPHIIESKKLNSLQKAVYQRDLKKVKSLMREKNRDIDKMDTYHHVTALHLAVEYNYTELVLLLLTGCTNNGVKKCASVNVVNSHGKSSMHLAVIYNHYNLVDLLHRNSGSIDLLDKIGCAPIHYAILLDHRPIFNWLLEKGAKLDVIDLVRIELFNFL